MLKAWYHYNRPIPQSSPSSLNPSSQKSFASTPAPESRKLFQIPRTKAKKKKTNLQSPCPFLSAILSLSMGTNAANRYQDITNGTQHTAVEKRNRVKRYVRTGFSPRLAPWSKPDPALRALLADRAVLSPSQLFSYRGPTEPDHVASHYIHFVLFGGKGGRRRHERDISQCKCEHSAELG